MEYFAKSRKLTKILNNPKLLVKKFGTVRSTIQIIDLVDYH
jgi:hypothetical protein